jgi:hypothetical protein
VEVFVGARISFADQLALSQLTWLKHSKYINDCFSSM